MPRLRNSKIYQSLSKSIQSLKSIPAELAAKLSSGPSPSSAVSGPGGPSSPEEATTKFRLRNSKMYQKFRRYIKAGEEPKARDTINALIELGMVQEGSFVCLAEPGGSADTEPLLGSDEADSGRDSVSVDQSPRSSSEKARRSVGKSEGTRVVQLSAIVRRGSQHEQAPSAKTSDGREGTDSQV